MRVMKLSVWDTPCLTMQKTKVVALLLRKGNIKIHAYICINDAICNNSYRFFEWKKLTEKKKIPYYTKRKDGKLMLFAGLYDHSHIDGTTEIRHVYFTLFTHRYRSILI